MHLRCLSNIRLPMSGKLKLISTTDELQKFCDGLRGCEFITVDTEFLRERTYYPKLCLIQVAGIASFDGEGASAGESYNYIAAIDPLADGIDLQPFFEILQNENILKIFHAGRQDIEIFHQLMDGKTPSPVFDTQIAAQVCGLGEQVGYGAICSRLLGVDICKAHQFTDWSVRPLSDKQLSYAIADVTHLCDIYKVITTDIMSEERARWVASDMEELCDPELYNITDEKICARLRKKNHKPEYLARLNALAIWRESEAMRSNKPKGWILHDDAMQEIALTNPKNINALKKVRAIKSEKSRYLNNILDIVRAANESDLSRNGKKQKPKRLSPELEGVSDILRLVLKIKCAEHEVAPKMIASSDDIKEFLQLYDDNMRDKEKSLDEFIAQNSAKISFMHGWRYEIFGQYVKNILKGEIAISLDSNGKIIVKTI